MMFINKSCRNEYDCLDSYDHSSKTVVRLDKKGQEVQERNCNALRAMLGDSLLRLSSDVFWSIKPEECPAYTGCCHLFYESDVSFELKIGNYTLSLLSTHYINHPDDLEALIRCCTDHPSASVDDYKRALSFDHNFAELTKVTRKHFYSVIAKSGDIGAMIKCMDLSEKWTAEYEVYQSFVQLGYEERLSKYIDETRNNRFTIMKKMAEYTNQLERYEAAMDYLEWDPNEEIYEVLDELFENGVKINSNMACNNLFKKIRNRQAQRQTVFNDVNAQKLIERGKRLARLAQQVKFSNDSYKDAIHCFLIVAYGGCAEGYSQAALLYEESVAYVGKEGSKNKDRSILLFSIYDDYATRNWPINIDKIKKERAVEYSIIKALLTPMMANYPTRDWQLNDMREFIKKWELLYLSQFMLSVKDRTISFNPRYFAKSPDDLACLVKCFMNDKAANYRDYKHFFKLCTQWNFIICSKSDLLRMRITQFIKLKKG